MTKISRIVAAAGALGVMGVAALPVAGYAAGDIDTIVKVNVTAECLIGDGQTGNDYEGVTLLDVQLSAATPYAETLATDTTSAIGTVCNAPKGYSITETMDHADLKLEASGAYTGATGFNAGAGSGALASFANNTWSIKYANVIGTTVDTDATTYDRTPDTTGIIIASTAGPTALNTISQQFGAKTDGTVPTGNYGATVEYTIAQNL